MWPFVQLWDREDQNLALQPSEPSEATCRRFVGGLLEAAVSLETSSENPAAWKCCMHSDGMNSPPRCTLVW